MERLCYRFLTTKNVFSESSFARTRDTLIATWGIWREWRSFHHLTSSVGPQQSTRTEGRKLSAILNKV